MFTMMKFNMSRVVDKNHQIFNAIIRRVIIDMMHNFFGREVSVKLFFCNKTVFKDIASFFGKRVKRHIYYYISSFIYNLAAFPPIVFFPFWGIVPSMSFFKFCFRRSLFTLFGNTNFSFMFFGKRYFTIRRGLPFAPSWATYCASMITFCRTIFFSTNMTTRNVKAFFAYKTNLISTIFSTHVLPQIKSLCSACLQETVRFLTHTKRLVVDIKNPFLVSNTSISHNFSLVN